MNRYRVFEILRRRGRRMTPLKRAVVDLFLRGGCGLCAAEVRSELGGDWHISTVHRCLSTLESDGFLRHDRVSDGRLRYRCAREFYPDHAHIRCGSCGSRIPVDLNLPPGFIEDVERRTGFRISGTDILLEGSCPTCGDR